jgi:hypothetical protein
MRQDIGFIRCHSRVRGNPVFSRENGKPENFIPACAGIKTWIPASAGMTRRQSRNRTKLLAIAIKKLQPHEQDSYQKVAEEVEEMIVQ